MPEITPPPMSIVELFNEPFVPAWMPARAQASQDAADELWRLYDSRQAANKARREELDAKINKAWRKAAYESRERIMAKYGQPRLSVVK